MEPDDAALPESVLQLSDLLRNPDPSMKRKALSCFATLTGSSNQPF
jgi:hypothetical protein